MTRLRPTVVALVALAASLAAAAPARADVTVAITPTGVVPSDVTVRAGEGIHWTNGHFLSQTVTAADGLFDSGAIPSGGGFSMALSVPGEHTYASAANPIFTGTIRVIARALGGSPDDLARDRVPELTFPVPDADDIGTHPLFGAKASTTRVVLGIDQDATVAAVNAALAEVDANIVGGLPSLGILLIVVPERDGELERFTGLADALERLRASGAFEAASMSLAVEPHAVPRRAEPDVESVVGKDGVADFWRWSHPGGANWGLKDARFPEAWNLREAIARRNPSVVTGVVDVGFEAHVDLTPQLRIVPQLCPGAGACVTLPNTPVADFRGHGNHVSGIINASWDNPLTNEPPSSQRSRGVSGGNPFAKLEGVSLEGTEQTGAVSSFVLYDTVVHRFDAFLRDRPAGLRVINYSAGARAFDDAAAWSRAFPNPTCGPGATDDSLPEIVAGTKDYCTQQNQDDWLREWAHIGMHARSVAEFAEAANVMIVQSAGNDSDVFCLPWGEKSCPAHPETRRIIHAENSVEFGWASKHWEGGVNPILIAEASRIDGYRAIYSNIAGDISAPGTRVWSTWNQGYRDDSGTSMAAPHVTAALGYLLADDPSLTIQELRDKLVHWSRPPPASPIPPANVFEWDTAPRYGLDADADGVVDAPVSPADLQPPLFPVDFDACGFSLAGDPIVSYTWTVEGEIHVTGSCRFRHAFSREGTFNVTVTSRDADGDVSTGARDVVVDDLVLAAVGDGVTAGESAPDRPGVWQDARCHGSGRGAAAQTARWLESAHVASTVTFLNVACLGARIRGDGPADGGVLTPFAGFEPADPPLAPQLEQLANGLGSRELDALLLSAGAGDLAFAAIAADCVQAGNDCSTGEGRTIFEERLPVLPLRYGELASRIGQLGISAERVLIAEYGDFTRNADGHTSLACIDNVSAPEAAWLGDTVLQGLNDAVRAAALLHGWTVVPSEDLATHGLCTAEPWFGETLHPNAAGHGALAKRFVAAFRALHGETAIDPRRAHGDAAPRLDVFASLLTNDGAATRLVDVNDVTRDGNKRVVRTRAADGTLVETDDKTISASGPKTSGDGYVDLRDFRRFRDAWLASCLTSDADASCPAASSILLDGPPDHVKRDLNFDGCVHRAGDPAGCGADEQQFSRFDFNGDRHVSVERRALMPLEADGAPAELRDEGTKMTDLDVFRTQWNPSPAIADGWSAADLDALLRSADVEIHADGIFSTGARMVDVEVLGPGGIPIGATRKIQRRNGLVVVTVPVSSIHDEVVVVARGKGSDGTFTGRSAPFTLRYGEDVRVDVGRGLALRTSDDRLPADGTSSATLTASVAGAGSAGRSVTWTVSPASGGAELEDAEPQTDGTGRATAKLVAGTEPKTYTVQVEVDLGDGEIADAEVAVEVQPLVTIRYVWRQEIVDWVEEGTTRWETFDPARPDCTLAIGIEYCIDESRIELDESASPALLRRGTITGGADTFVVTDTPSSELPADGFPVAPGFGESRVTWTESAPNDALEPESFESGAQWWIAAEDRDGYEDHPVEGVIAEDGPDEIRVGGLHAVGDLPYRYFVIGTSDDELRDELHAIRTDFFLTPKDPAFRIRFATGSKQQAVFRRTADGFEPFQSCGRMNRDLTAEPGYLVEGEPDENVVGSTGTIGRKEEYTPGDRPMPIGPGRLDVRYSFAATVAYEGEEPADPVLPDCGGFAGEPNAGPEADFEWEAADPSEGRMIRFRDRSTDLEDEIVEWKWEHDGLEGASGLNANFKAVSDEQDPWFVFPDDGPVTMKLTVTDKEGATDTVEQVVQLANVAPEAYIADAVGQAGQPFLVGFAVMDTGDQDKRALNVRIESSNPDWQTVQQTQQGGLDTTVVTLPAGAYPLTLTVSDRDGASASAEALLVVTEEASAPPDDGSGPDTPTCLPGVALDVEEQAFVAVLNEYRDQNGLDPVDVSGTLSVAADGHARDMALNDYFAHEGLDGSSPSDRAWRAGYPPEHGVGENLARGLETSFDALLGWRGSLTGHNENMIVPTYAAIGVGRFQGYWATSYGNVLDCTGTAGAGGGDDGGGEGEGETETADGEYAVLSSLAGGAAEPVAPAAAVGEGSADEEAGSAAATPIFPPTVAFTLSKARPRVGQEVVLTNRSDVSAAFELGPEPHTPIAPGESTTHAFLALGPASVRLSEAGGPGELTRPLDVLGSARLNLSYTGSNVGAAGKQLTVSARADDPDFAVPVGGLELEFRLGSATATATTDDTGRATAQLDLAGVGAGRYEVVALFAGDGEYPAAEARVFVDLFVNTPPVARPGGPYVAGQGGALLLDGSDSTDPDLFVDRVGSWRWDLDGDGAFDDLLKATHLLQAHEVEAAVCGGACETDHDYPIALEVTDLRGEANVASTTVRFVPDFAVVLAGGAMTVVPGSSPSHFAVTVVGSSSWTAPITLFVAGLPSGVSATFSKNPVTPTDVSVLTLTAISTAAAGDAVITVVGTGGGVTRTTAADVTVSFGLVPQCFGRFTGVITDRDTGAPIAGATLVGWNVTSGADGRYVFANVELGFNNQPRSYNLIGSATGYWTATRQAQAVCGATTQLDFQLRLRKKGELVGRVVDRETRAPIASALVAAPFESAPQFTTLADGTFSGQLDLNLDNATRTYLYRGEAPDYWFQDKQITMTADVPTPAEFELVRKCFGTFVGGVVHREGTMIPVPNVRVNLSGFAQFAISDANGVYRFDLTVPLGYENTPVSYQPFLPPQPAIPVGPQPTLPSPVFSSCGQQVTFDIPVRFPVVNQGAIEGYATEEESGAPLAGVTVGAPGPTLGAGQTAVTDASGFYRFDKVFIGFDGVTSGHVGMNASRDGHYGDAAFVPVSAGQTTRRDFRLLRIRFATLDATVLDAATGVPIPGASLGSYGATDRNGRFVKTDVPLGFRNQPLSTLLTATADGYWQKQQPVTFRADETVTPEFRLVRECTSASIRGRVVNALTQEPILNAAVFTSAGGFVFTNANGEFLLAGLRAGPDNLPVLVQVTASAAGFLAQTKPVTIYCGGTITLDFGSRSTATGTIVGTVTNLDTGTPVAGAFVGAEFGAVATTDAAGNYAIPNVPLADLDADRDWRVTARVPGFPEQAATVTARAGVEVRADFGFTQVGNGTPVADAASVTLAEDSFEAAVPVTGTDPDGHSLEFHVVEHPAHGTLRGLPPDLKYTPEHDYNGPDSLKIVATDGQDTSAPATISIQVTPVNDFPFARPDSAERPAGAPARIPLSLLLENDTDVDGDLLTVTSVFAFGGTAMLMGTDVVVSRFGPGDVTVFYNVSDGKGGTSGSQLVVRFVVVALAPVCVDVVFDGTEDAPLSGQLVCTDANGDSLTYSLAAPPAEGDLSLAPSGAFTYTPAPGFSGTTSFRFTASDGTLSSTEATATIRIAPDESAPVCADAAYSGAEDELLAASLACEDVDGDELTYALVSPPAHGTLDLQADGSFSYRPAVNRFGSDSFAFRASGGGADSGVATAAIEIAPVNDPPSVADLTVETDEDTPLRILLTGSDVDGDTLTIGHTAPAHGSFGGETYTPSANYHGPDSFTYTADDGHGGAATATVSITIHPVNDPPSVADLTVETDEDTPLRILLTGSDIDGDTLTIGHTAPAHGSFGGETYTPSANYHGPDSFTYTADDGHGGTATAAVSITVRSVNDPPSVTLTPLPELDEGAPPIPLAATAVDPDGTDGLTYEWSAGSGTLTPAGPTAGYANDDGPRTDTIRVTVSDGEATATDSIEVAIRNLPPRADAGPDVTSYWGLPLVFAGAATEPSSADRTAGLAGQWSFGDRTLPVAGLSAGHVYTQPGSYAAELTVTDKDGGNGADSTAVTIERRATALELTGPTEGLYGLRALTARLVDDVDEPTADLAGHELVFTVGSHTFTATTDAEGLATAESALPLTSGTAQVSFAGSTRYLPSSTEAELTIVSGPGKITGGGLRSLDHDGRGGFNVRGASDGELQWQSRDLDFHAQELTALGVAADARSAWFAGVGRDGRPFTAYVEDNGEPGRDDVFVLWIGGVLQTPGSGRLSGGNIQIHDG